MKSVIAKPPKEVKKKYPWVGVHDQGKQYEIVVMFTSLNTGIVLHLGNPSTSEYKVGNTNGYWSEQTYKPTEITLSSRE